MATGTQPDVAAAFPGAAEAGAVDTSVALHAELGSRALVYDTVGANEGVLVAEAIARRGHQVTFVTPYETAMPQGGQLHRVQLGTTLHDAVDRVIVRALVGMVEAGAVTVASPEGAVIDEIDVDSIVVAVAPIPELGLFPVLPELGIPYRLVGDAVSPRLAMPAYKESHEAGLAV